MSKEIPTKYATIPCTFIATAAMASLQNASQMER
jgi:hypothetical protein